MDENNNLNVTNTPVTNETPVAPTPVEPAAPITPAVEAPVVNEAPVAPAPEVAPAPVETTPVVSSPSVAPTPEVAPAPEEPKKKSNALVVILLILVLLGVVGYGLYTYTDIFKGDKKTSGDTTTTTTTTAVVNKDLEINTIDDYVKIVKDNNYSENQRVLNLDKSFYAVDYAIKSKCLNSNDSITFKVNDLNVKYTCTSDTNAPEGEKEWDVNVSVNDTYKTNVITFQTCLSFNYYSNSKYMLSLTNGCSFAYNLLKVEDLNNNVIFNDKYEMHYISSVSEEGEFTYVDTPIIINNNKIYFIEGDKVDGNYVKSTCRVKKIDLDKENPTVEDMNVSGECIYTNGQ